MPRPPSSQRRERRPPRPLDDVRLRDLALAYVARFATSTAKLEAYLARKLRERGWEGEGPADPAALAARFAELGYIDDAAYARMKAGSLTRRGYGARRVAQKLNADGIGEEDREAAAPNAGEARSAALALARRRRLGPFGAEPPRDKVREKQLAAMLRAGHPFASAQAMVDAPTIEEAEEWVASAQDIDAHEPD